MATAEKPSEDATKGPTNTPDELTETPVAVIRIGFGAWLRSMYSIACGAFLHPLSTTCVDLSTGDSVQLAE